MKGYSLIAVVVCMVVATERYLAKIVP